MTCCCLWFSQPATLTTRSENGSRHDRMPRKLSRSLASWADRRHGSIFQQLAAAKSTLRSPTGRSEFFDTTRSLTSFSGSTVELIKFMTSPEAAPLLLKSYGAARALDGTDIRLIALQLIVQYIPTGSRARCGAGRARFRCTHIRAGRRRHPGESLR
jgi:hypothetical protein